MKSILSILFVSSLIFGCSLDVKKAYAPTDPPKVAKSDFNKSHIQGSYQQNGSPKMFYWPENKLNEETGALTPMSFQEKAISRQKITAYADDVTLYEGKMIDEENRIIAKYDTLKAESEGEWRGNKCYSLCEPDGEIFCLPDDDSVLFIDDWKTPENEEEETLIASCQENQSYREGINETQSEEMEEKVTPLQKKAGDAGLALLREVGDRNYFTDLTLLEFHFGPFQCSQSSGECEKSGQDEQIFIKMKYGDVEYSNFQENETEYKVTGIELDFVDGFLIFKIPAVDLEDDNRIYGEITFNLEFVPDSGKLQVNGDFSLENFDTKQTRIGRFASSGKINLQKL